MLDFSRSRIWMLNILVLLGVLLAIPSLLPKAQLGIIPDFIPKETINLGLDLAGGSHLLLEADPNELRKTRLETLEDSVTSGMRRAQPRIAISDVSRSGGKLTFLVDDASQIDAAREVLLPLIGNVLGGRDWDIGVTDGNRVTLTASEAGFEAALGQAMDSAKDVINDRINRSGTLEPTIIRQGDERIVVQVPGLTDPAALKELIGKTAKLEFKLVDEDNDPDDTAAGKARVGTQIYPMRDESGNIAVRRLGGISGGSGCVF